jgi:protein TBF1
MVLEQPGPSTQHTRSPLHDFGTRFPSSTAPASLPAGTPYSQINQIAKQNVLATKERDNKHILQQRKPYTEEEVHRLMDLIAINQGPKYAKILKDDEKHPAGPLLQGRSQVQLKDKARNIKMDFLK